ncbi:MAG TPA: alkaline phosphatase D family protein [Chitinophagales bacterium]|nr:alkaline phosphatase D family protein [Chitinophagales bacterium]HMW13736.1 alkaline phosphatase D family protein [Chitinophagales bacterium]HMX60519.1 alkaline phosphatase D family protein [Chitinophagales bacterium]HMY22998.1 alkaline phosphatase D family protein [Chitinophagales bacterium]HNB48066.1 alkaline phosphatase D family protein [Chitinophagales bacterium]
MRNLYKFGFFLLSMFLFLGNINANIYPNDRSLLDSTIQPFYHGVASGDPLNDRVIIWTRVTTDQVSVPVKWRMATDTGMQNIVGQGTFTTDSSRDYTVKVDVVGLQPNTYYYYEFEALGRLSQRGRTKTMPTGSVNNLRIAFMSCSNYSFGYFNAYDAITRRNDVDLLIHLGDYIYEDGLKTGPYVVDTIKRRTFPEYDAFDLVSYRQRYAWYRLDPSLRNLHQQFPMVVIWDDHEFANDATKDTALRHDPVKQGPWAVRKATAIRVYKEWIPMREDTSNTNIINFTQPIGDLADIIYTENRIERIDAHSFQQAYDLVSHIDNLPYDTPDRTMHGFRQMEWLTNQLKRSTAKWKVMANQVVFASYVYKQAILGIPFPFHNAAGWDINPLDRKMVLDTVNRYNLQNLVVLSGDIHVSMAFDLPGGAIPYDPATGEGSIGVEFVCDNTVRGGLYGGQQSYMYTNNQHLKYINPNSLGYCVLDLTPTSACCDYWETDTSGKLSSSLKLLGTWCTKINENHLKPYPGPTYTSTVFPALVPYTPRNNGITVGVKNTQRAVELMSVFPNPTQHYLRFQYFIKAPENLVVTIYDMLGNAVKSVDYGQQGVGLHQDGFPIMDLAPAEYIITFQSGTDIVSRKFIKH